MKKNSEEIESSIIDLLESIGYLLVELFIKSKSSLLRVTICRKDKTNIAHSDCVLIHRKLNELIDDENWTVEVWSPGIDRELKTAREYLVFQNSEVEVTCKDQTINGILVNKDEEFIYLQLENGEEHKISLVQVKKVKLLPQKVENDENKTVLFVEDLA